MQVIGTSKGFIIRCETEEELEGTIENLWDWLEWIRQENVEPPYLYMTHDEMIDTVDVQEMLEDIKSRGVYDVA